MDYGRVKIGLFDDPRKLQNEELLVFGYSCRIFRDDEKALSLENGEHLIPWMGDSALMIDRFDVRGALYDLGEAEAKGKPLEEVLTEAELKEEEICEQERYFALYHDEFQYQLASEEEAKRLQVELASDGSVYNQVGFNYMPLEQGEVENKDDSQVHQPVMAEPVNYNPSSDEDLFIPPPELNIPPGVEVPKTVKQNKIIIKTAKFVVTQGAQMEIIIKTKQAGNPMFSFLAFDNPLNPYYKLLVTLIRHGRYRCEDEMESAERNDQYLHPNLSQSQLHPPPDLTPGATSSPARPSPHCAYSNLITKIREKQKATTSAPVEEVEPAPAASSSPLRASTPSIVPVSQGPPPPTGPIVGLVDYPSSFHMTADGNSDGEESEPRKATRGPTRDYRHIKWPPPDLQMVIDKMACYIIKNGAAFEEVVKSRGDPRFEFLNKAHEYHQYYKCKMQLYNEVYGDIFKTVANKGHHDWRKKTHTGSSEAGSVNGGGPPLATNKKSNSSHSLSENVKNAVNRTICFSIKSREQEVPLTSRTTFPIESSTSEEDEELDEDEKERRRVERAQRRQARRQREEREKKEREELLKKERLKKEKEEAEMRKMAEEDSSGNEDLYDIFKYAQEMERESRPSQIRAQQQQQQQQQQQHDSPDEASSKQEERKKKAAAFLSKLKDSKEEKRMPVYGPQIPPDIAADLLNSSSQSPCSSRGSVERERAPPPLPPLAESPHPPPPPLPKTPSPTLSPDAPDKGNGPVSFLSSSYGREMSSSPRMGTKFPDENSCSVASVLCGINEAYGKSASERGSESAETQNRKSRSHKKHSRQKSESRSPSGRRDRKKRKRSRGRATHRRKKRRSRSRSRSKSRAYTKSHRSHKKKQNKHHTSHRDKDKGRKKKHKKHRSPSLVSSLPSSDSSSPSTPSTLPSESDMDVQVIESDEIKRSSRGSSVVSLPPTASVSRISDLKKIRSGVLAEVEEAPKKGTNGDECISQGEETSSGTSAAISLQTHKYSRAFLSAMESSNSSDGAAPTVEKKLLFDPNASNAMAKIAQGLRAKLNAMLEKENKMD